jgi:hypothetical protein
MVWFVAVSELCH